MEKVKLVTFGLGGHGEYCEGCKINGYYRPGNFKASKDRDYEGAVVLDQRGVFERRPMLALSEPMVNVNITEVERCPEPSSMMKEGLQGGFKTLLNMNEVQRKSGSEFSGLDQIPLSMYVERWRGYGARVGKITNDEIAWEE